MSLLDKDVDTIILQFLSVDDLKILRLVNTHYNNLIIPLLQEYLDFYTYAKTNNLYSSDKSDKIFRIAIEYGNLNVCKYLHSKFKYDIHNKDENFFRWSCYNNKLHIAKWLHSLGGIDTHIQEDDAFVQSCIYSLDCAIWLHSFGNICSSAVHRGFLNGSRNNFKIAKWLYSVYNITKNTKEYAFMNSCEDNRITTAKWLYSLGGINIRANNDRAFKASCSFRYKDIAEWLCTLYTGYHITITDYKINYIIE